MGESNVQRSQNYLERNIENPQTPGLGYLDLVGNIHPYARVFMYILTAGRLILLLISIKHLSICKLYIYYEFLLTILNQFLPESCYAYDQALIVQLSQLHNFLFFYFQFWPSLILSLSTLPWQLFCWSCFHGVEITGPRFSNTLVNMAYLGIYLSLCHIILSKVGALFVEAEVKSTGRRQLLDNLEDGVIIL